MAKIFIVYYSTYGHVVKLAEAIKEGVEKTAGVTAEIYQVPETLSKEVLEKLYAPEKQAYPIITPDKLAEADGILFGFPTRFGSLPAQMTSFIDATGQLWMQGALHGKPAGVFYSTGGQHGGQETAAYTFLTTLTSHGMVFVPLGYKNVSEYLTSADEIMGGSPYGAGTISGANGSRTPSEKELAVARVQGKQFAEVVTKLSARVAAQPVSPAVQVDRKVAAKKDVALDEKVKVRKSTLADKLKRILL
ncbi:uncharacterized protein VTP21DRAFT_5240 [Calcarisporiella thermophila]|uniref:uncharacterized protein n=1 Tax=Calcarisporiella thermophila TaxID=911321 RepID=UPI003742FAE5